MIVAREKLSSLEDGTVVDGRYRIERRHAIGGMGTIYRATHLLLARPVALKVLADELVGNQELVGRFLREARAATQLKNDHIVEVFDVGTASTGAPYLAMEWLEGEDLADVVARGPLPVDIALDYVLQACVALSEVHARGIVHRDLKPSNLFVTAGADDQPMIKLLDFGVSKIDMGVRSPRVTGAGAVMGTPAYMSPEQISGAEEADSRTDVWSLGVVLFELLTTIVPFDGNGIADIFSAILFKPRPKLGDYRPDIPIGLEDVVAKCLAQKADDRYASVAELAEALAPFGPPGAYARADAAACVARAAKSKPIQVRVSANDERWIKQTSTPRSSLRLVLGRHEAEARVTRNENVVNPSPRLELVSEMDNTQHAVIAPKIRGRTARRSRRRAIAIACAVAAFSIGIPAGARKYVPQWIHDPRAAIATFSSHAVEGPVTPAAPSAHLSLENKPDHAIDIVMLPTVVKPAASAAPAATTTTAPRAQYPRRAAPAPRVDRDMSSFAAAATAPTTTTASASNATPPPSYDPDAIY